MQRIIVYIVTTPGNFFSQGNRHINCTHAAIAPAQCRAALMRLKKHVVVNANATANTIAHLLIQHNLANEYRVVIEAAPTAAVFTPVQLPLHLQLINTVILNTGAIELHYRPVNLAAEIAA